MSLGNYTGPAAPAPIYPSFYTRVSSGSPGAGGARTTLHAVVDYDDDDYAADGGAQSYSSVSSSSSYQGPIVIKNDTVAVVPLYSYGPTVTTNGTLVHIPSKWKYCDRPKIENRNGASEKTFSCTHLLRITSRTSTLTRGDTCIITVPLCGNTIIYKKCRSLRRPSGAKALGG
ncbi:unnamed protein product [Nesidiocoris tenuis]|uniref:Uncharacterized protein n=1 Tax=Nesidiocoris tenuis TaxID=355587 RepID=A0A6H5H8V2_9HEMI|nr:unnamed protein product [Nesidiocoris tenuis]